MPTYQYRCPICEHEFEELQPITDDPIAICPKCGKKPKRIITGGAGILFKGSGFYITDYRSDSYKSAAAKDAPKKSSDSSDKSKKSDKKKSEDGKSGSKGSGS